MYTDDNIRAKSSHWGVYCSYTLIIVGCCLATFVYLLATYRFAGGVWIVIELVMKWDPVK